MTKIYTPLRCGCLRNHPSATRNLALNHNQHHPSAFPVSHSDEADDGTTYYMLCSLWVGFPSAAATSTYTTQKYNIRKRALLGCIFYSVLLCCECPRTIALSLRQCWIISLDYWWNISGCGVAIIRAYIEAAMSNKFMAARLDTWRAFWLDIISWQGILRARTTHSLKGRKKLLIGRGAC